MLKPRFDTVPEILRDRQQWILWRLVIRDGKEVKLPWSVYDDSASSTNPDTWHSFECVVMRYEPAKHAGIGFVFAEDDGFAGVDLDSCRDPKTGIIAPWAKRWLDQQEDCYAEVSPSETGIKIWLKCDLKLGKGRNIKINEHPVVPGKLPGVEMYTQGRYFAFTGHRIKDFSA